MTFPGAVTIEELQNDDDYGDIMEDMREECAKYGAVIAVRCTAACAMAFACPLLKFCGGLLKGRE